MAKDPAHRPQSGWEICSRLRQLGVSYPYERALQPKHMIPAQSTVAALSERPISSSARDMKRFLMLSGESLASARLILTANWRRGMLTYDNASFRFPNGVYWPSIIRRQVSQAWRGQVLARRKSDVRNAVILAAGAQLTPDELTDHADMLSSYLFSGMLTVTTIKRLSRKLAADRESQSTFDDAARLYIQTGDFASAERCALAAVKQYREKHQFAEAQALLHFCIDYGRMTRSPEAVCRLFLEHGEIHKDAGESELAEHAFLEITGNNSGPDYLIARAYNLLGDIYKAKRLFQPGVTALEKALEIFTRLGNSLEISHVTNNLGNVHSMTGDFRKALSYYRRALHVQRRLALKRDVASTVTNLGVVYYFLGNADRALAVMVLSLKLKRELGDRGEIARTLNNLGYLAHNQGYHREALEYLTESLALNREIGNQKEILFNLDNLGLVMLRSARLSDCLAYLKEGVRLALDLSDLSHLAAFTTQTGQVLVRMGQIREALQAADDALGHLNGISDGEIRAYLYRLRAELQYLLGRPAEAAALLRAAMEEKEIVGLAPARLALLTTLARIDFTPAEESEAYSLAEQLQVKDFGSTLAIEKMESALARHDLSEATALAPRLTSFINAEKNAPRHIDSTRSLLSLGELKLRLGELEPASEYLIRASGEARDTGLLPEMISSSILRAEILFGQSDYETCYQLCRKALELSKQMLTGTDQATQISFQKTRHIQRLAAMIGRLGTILAKKERAG